MRYLVLTLIFFNLVLNKNNITLAGPPEVAPSGLPGPANPGSSGPDACEMLPEYTCSDGILNDGTGTMVRNNTQAQQQQIIDDSYTSLVRQFQSALTNAENPPTSRDIDIALSASGGTLAPACREEQRFRNGRLNFACARFLALFMARKANSDIFDGNNLQGFFNQSETSLEDLDMMVNSGLYTSVFRAHNEQLLSGQDFTQTTERAEAIFNQSREVMGQFITSNITNRNTREQLLNKVNAIRFQGVDCASPNSDTYSLDSSFMTGAFYVPTDNTFRYCNGLAAQGLSEYNMVAIITHEMAHSIDPCLIADGPRISRFNYSSDDPENSEYPFQVLDCLRSDESVQAFDPNNPPEEFQQMGGGFPQGFPGMPGRPTEPPEPFCDRGDQINESFCDWMGAEVLARYMQNRPNATRQQHIDGLASIWRPFCNDRDGLGPSNLGQPSPSNHPSTRDRLQRITLAQPTIRRLIGCTPLSEDSEIRYCDHRNPYVPPASEVQPSTPNQNQTPGEDNGVF